MVLSWKENLPTELKEKVDKVDKMIEPRLEEIDEQVFYNQQRVLGLFRKHRVGEEDLVPSTGYGYDDVGRDKQCMLITLKQTTPWSAHNFLQQHMQLLLVFSVCFALVILFTT